MKREEREEREEEKGRGERVNRRTRRGGSVSGWFRGSSLGVLKAFGDIAYITGLHKSKLSWFSVSV